MAGETLRFTVLGRGDASDLDRLAAAVDRITDQIRDLDNARANPEIDVDTRRATQQTGKFAKDFQRTLTRAIESIPEVELDADASDAQREIQAVRAQLVELSDQRLGVDIDADEAQRRVGELKARLEALGDVDLDVQMRADVGAAVSQLAAVNGEIDRLDGRTAKVKIDVDRSLSETVIQIAALGRALGALAAPAALIAAAPTIAALGAAAVEATGAIGVLPAVLAAASGATAALKVGLSGVKEALKVRDDAEAFAEALKELSPAAAEFATKVRDLGPAWKTVRLDVQQALFAGLGEELGKLSDAYLPGVQAGLSGIAAGFNGMAKDLVTFARESQTVADVDTIFRNTKAALEEARPAASNLAAAFVDIATVGSDMLPELAEGITGATGRFREFIAEARESGQLQEWIQGGVDALSTLGSIAGNVGSTLLSVFASQKAAGADLLRTLDQLTAKMAAWASSAEGQRVLVDIFSEIRATIDAIMPGLQALGEAAMQAVAAFANTGGLQAAATGLSDLAEAIAPLLPALAELAGNALGILGSALSAAAAAVGPVVSALVGLLDALGPIGPAVLAVAVAFKGLSGVGGVVAGLGTSLAGLATKAGASETATGRLATVFRGLGTAVPIAAAALVAVIALYEQAASKADESAKAILNGSMSMKQAIDLEVGQLENRNAAYRAANIEGQEFASVQQNAGAATRGLQTEQSALTEATENQTRAVQEQYNKLSPFEKLQADVAMATRELNDAIASGDTAGAAAAADRLAAADSRLEQAQKQAADAAKTHEERLRDLGDTMRSQAGAALSYEQAVLRTAEAQDRANQALKEHGADSTEYKSEVLSLAQAQLAQADAAQAQADALGVTKEQFDAFNTELLRMDTSTQAGKDAFAKIAAGMDDTGRAALSAAARATGLRTEIIKLPNGKTVEVVVQADKGELDTVKKEAEEIARKKYVGSITLNGDPKPFQGQLLQSVKLADGTVAMMKLNADKSPASIVVNGLKYEVDQTTGTLKVLGDVAPGKATLDGFKIVVDQTTGTMQIVAADGQARATNAALKTSVDTSIGTITINGDPTQANGQTQAAVTFADGSQGTITIDGDPATARGNITATVRYADGSTGTITVTENGTASVNRAIDNAARDRTATIRVVQIFEPGAPGRPGGTGLAGGGVVGYSGGGLAPARAANGMVVRGYQPGRDTVPAVISRGEAVLVPELVRMLGARRILAANAAASGGREPTTIGQLAGMMDGTIGRRFAGGGMVRAEDGSYVPSNYWSKGGGAGYTLGSSLGSLGLSVRRMAGGGVAGSSRAMPRWAPTSTGGSRDSLAREIHALAEELRERGRKDVNIVNNFAIENASQAADEVARTQRVAGALGIFGD